MEQLVKDLEEIIAKWKEVEISDEELALTVEDIGKDMYRAANS